VAKSLEHTRLQLPRAERTTVESRKGEERRGDASCELKKQGSRPFILWSGAIGDEKKEGTSVVQRAFMTKK